METQISINSLSSSRPSNWWYNWLASMVCRSALTTSLRTFSRSIRLRTISSNFKHSTRLSIDASSSRTVKIFKRKTWSINFIIRRSGVVKARLVNRRRIPAERWSMLWRESLWPMLVESMLNVFDGDRVVTALDTVRWWLRRLPCESLSLAIVTAEPSKSAKDRDLRIDEVSLVINKVSVASSVTIVVDRFRSFLLQSIRCLTCSRPFSWWYSSRFR